jgi:ribosomal protein S27AE
VAPRIIHPFTAARITLSDMPRSRKINREKVQVSLDTPCPKCGFSILPAQLRRVDFERIECPKCGENSGLRTSDYAVKLLESIRL